MTPHTKSRLLIRQSVEGPQRRRIERGGTGGGGRGEVLAVGGGKMGMRGGEGRKWKRKGEVQKMFMIVRTRRESIGAIKLVWGCCCGR